MAAVTLNFFGFYNLQSMSVPPPWNFFKTPKQRNVTARSSAISTIVRDTTQQWTSSSAKSVTCNKLCCSQELTETRHTKKSKLKEYVESDMTYTELTGKAEESSDFLEGEDRQRGGTRTESNSTLQ